MHPELKEHEFFLSNVKIGEEWKFGICNDAPAVGGNRLGKIAYDSSGGILPSHRPVFAIDWRHKIVNGKIIRIAGGEIHPHDRNCLTEDEIAIMHATA